MRKPTIHLNGTDRESLLDSYQAASTALREALEALEAAAPNGRDYYPQGPTAVAEAVQEHRSRTGMVRSVKSEIDELVLYLIDWEPGGE